MRHAEGTHGVPQRLRCLTCGKHDVKSYIWYQILPSNIIKPHRPVSTECIMERVGTQVMVLTQRSFEYHVAPKPKQAEARAESSSHCFSYCLLLAGFKWSRTWAEHPRMLAQKSRRLGAPASVYLSFTITMSMTKRHKIQLAELFTKPAWNFGLGSGWVRPRNMASLVQTRTRKGQVIWKRIGLPSLIHKLLDPMKDYCSHRKVQDYTRFGCKMCSTATICNTYRCIM